MPKMGDPLPVGWDTIFFPRVVRHSQCGPDGHPARGDFLPPVPLPRRMFAGRRIRFESGLLIGDEIKRESTIKGVTIKQGRTGQMVFVTVQIEITSPRGLAVTEEQDIVYREASEPGAPPPAPQPAPAKSTWRNTVTPDEVMLFRYSAITFNGHRIHYDHPYVTGTEGYPGLVMNGGLTTLLTGEARAIEQHAATCRHRFPLTYDRCLRTGRSPSAASHPRTAGPRSSGQPTIPARWRSPPRPSSTEMSPSAFLLRLPPSSVSAWQAAPSKACASST
jgi:hydroxyacyl-ACP dehydratase HTD2-like protein with hotdog domain